MKTKTKIWLVVLAMIFLVLFMPKKEGNPYLSHKYILGDYANAPTTVEKRVNISQLVDKIEEANINTYAFLMTSWKPKRWEDFQLLLEATKDKELDIFAYLVPPSENCANVPPYYCNFYDWAENLAILSLKYPNLKGYIIDDFYDYDFWTEEYVDSFTSRAKEINPNFVFYPIVYAREFARFYAFSPYAKYIDGIVFPYHGPIEECNMYETQWIGPQIDLFKNLYQKNHQYAYVEWPSETKSNLDDFGGIKTRVSSLNNKNTLRILLSNEYYNPSLDGYHKFQILRNNDVILEEDLTELKYRFDEIMLDISGYDVNDIITLRFFEEKIVYNYPLRYTIMPMDGLWEITKQGNFITNLETYPDRDLDLVMMIYTTGHSRCGIAETDYVLEATNIVMDRMKQGDTLGLILYNLPLDDTSEGSKYDGIKQIYGAIDDTKDPVIPESSSQDYTLYYVIGGVVVVGLLLFRMSRG